MAGFSLAFGAMFSKTWRVHSIFTDVKLNKKVIKDYQLFMVVGVLLFIDLVIMTTWQVADPFYRETKQMEPYVSFDYTRFMLTVMLHKARLSSRQGVKYSTDRLADCPQQKHMV